MLRRLRDPTATRHSQLEVLFEKLDRHTSGHLEASTLAAMAKVCCETCQIGEQLVTERVQARTADWTNTDGAALGARWGSADSIDIPQLIR